MAGPSGARYDIFMAPSSEKTWMVSPMRELALALLQSYRKYPNRPVQTLSSDFDNLTCLGHGGMAEASEVVSSRLPQITLKS